MALDFDQARDDRQHDAQARDQAAGQEGRRAQDKPVALGQIRFGRVHDLTPTSFWSVGKLQAAVSTGRFVAISATGGYWPNLSVTLRAAIPPPRAGILLSFRQEMDCLARGGCAHTRGNAVTYAFFTSRAHLRHIQRLPLNCSLR